MKHTIIIGLLLAGAVVAYLSLNKTGTAETVRAAIKKVVPGHDSLSEGGVAAIGAKSMPSAPPETGITNATVETNAMAGAATNSWERATAGKYADLLQEIRNARGNAQ